MSRWTLLALLLLSGCANEYTRGPDFDVRAPMRMAVLPFTDMSSGDAVLSKPFTAVLDNLPLSDDSMQTPGTMIRNRVVAELQRTRFDVLNPQVVDQAITQGDMWNPKMLASADPRSLGRGLGADLLLYGKLLEWDRNYYGVQSSITVRAYLRVVDVETGRTVYETEQEQSMSRGILGGPTGAVSAITAPIFGLAKEQFLRVSNDVARDLVTPLVPEAEAGGNASSAPYIAAATHAMDGKTLTVYMVGTPGARGRFRLGHHGPEVPMAEFGAGRYRGSYVMQPGDSYEGAKIVITLNVKGRRTRAVVMR